MIRACIACSPTTSHAYDLQNEVTAVLLEGSRGGKALEGGSMKGTIAKRFEELDWDNNGKSHVLHAAHNTSSHSQSQNSRL